MLRSTSMSLVLCAVLCSASAFARADTDDVVVDQYVPVPADQVDVITEVAPSAKDVWVPGYWEREPGQWDWVKGHWDIPPSGNAYWVDGDWKWQNSKWHWEHGHWAISDTGKGWVVDEYIPVPEKLDEVIPEKPSGMNHWVAGYWDWNGHWFWVPGYWTNLPNPKAHWVDGHWQENFISGNWYWVGGHWVVK